MDGSAVVHSFAPEDDARAFRTALGSFATGVTVVTTDSADGPVGITANSFASLSLDPPLVLWSPAKGSRRYPYFTDPRPFAIHVLGADQRRIGDDFLASISAFDDLDWTRSEAGVPMLRNALASFECTFHAAHDGGDHTIVVGRVIRAHRRAGAPLVFHGGNYGTFTGDPTTG